MNLCQYWQKVFLTIVEKKKLFDRCSYNRRKAVFFPWLLQFHQLFACLLISLYLEKMWLSETEWYVEGQVLVLVQIQENWVFVAHPPTQGLLKKQCCLNYLQLNLWPAEEPKSWNRTLSWRFFLPLSRFSLPFIWFRCRLRLSYSNGSPINWE